MTEKQAIAEFKDRLRISAMNKYADLIPEYIEAMQLAISALEKQEQTNTQNINSTHTSRPNALESLNILEQAKDDKGCVPMSLVRQAFRNILELYTEEEA